MIKTESLWNKFATYDNFLLAWQRTVNVSNRMVHDELGMKIFAHNLQANLEYLIQQVKAEDFPYKPLADHKVYVPKPSTTLRTMSLMAVPDVILYQALVNIIADKVHPYLVTHENQHVFGNLYAGPDKRWMLRPWKKQYTRFVNRVERLYHCGNPWIASTDIVAFYDTIDHARLLSLVRKYCGEDQRFEELFKECIATWAVHNTNITMSRGIPQGSNASDFLANLFLYEIDKEMIAHGYQYVRYVDDIRILGSDKSIVQRGLILFDLELKRAGLVAQVTKTSIHKIENIDDEISCLRFTITDPTGKGDYVLLTLPSIPISEQAESATSHIKKTSSTHVEDNIKILNIDEPFKYEEEDKLDYDEEKADFLSGEDHDIDQNETPNLQKQLRDKFIEAFALLDNVDKGKEAESTVTFCLYRLEPHISIRDQVLSLLSKLAWRSEAITVCIGRFKNDSYVAEELKAFINEHNVYSWHRANSLWALYQVSGAKSITPICRAWLADTQLDWYARVIAARILLEVPGQHAYFMECVLSSETGLYDTGYANLLERKVLKNTLPHSLAIWERLNSMRNRVDHPVDRKTKSHATKISVKEVEFLHKQLQVALQEMFDIWLNSPSPVTTLTAPISTSTL